MAVIFENPEKLLKVLLDCMDKLPKAIKSSNSGMDVNESFSSMDKPAKVVMFGNSGILVNASLL